jgi:hypothetical protein
MNQFVTRISLPSLLFALVGAVLIWSIPTQAKLTVTPSVMLHSAGTGVAIWETDFAFDSDTNVGLAVFRQSGMFKVRGIYAQPTGQAASSAFDITSSAAYEVKGPRVAARSGGGGGFLVTYFISEIKQKRAVFVHPDSPTIPSVLIDEATWSSNNNIGGLAYVEQHDAFLVAYRKNADTYLKWVKVVNGSLQVSSSAVQVTSGDCNYVAPEIAWDFERDRALVTGWIDGCGGGVWMRRVSFNGSTISTLGSQTNLTAVGAEDVRVAFSDLIDRWLVVYVRRASTTPRHVLGNTVDPNGVVSSLRTILPANTGNASIADDRFGKDNGLGLAYNPFSGRFLVGVRGNDNGGLAPLYAVELDTDGVAIPKTFAEVLSFDISQPWPRLAALPNSQNFLMVAKGGPDAPFSQLRGIRIAADGTEGSGTWPLATSGGGGGGGGEEPPPPPPPPSGSFTLTVTRPTNGLIVGPDIWCGTTSATGTRCSVTKPAGTTIKLNAYPAPGQTLESWGGCSASFVLNANKSCAPTFSGTSPTPPPPSGSFTLNVTRPTNGLIVGPDIWCGTTSATGTRCSVTKPAGTTIWLNAYPAPGYSLSSWGACGSSFVLNANRNCSPIFSSSSAALQPASSTVPISLHAHGSTDGVGLGQWLGLIMPEQWVARTFAQLTAVNYGGHGGQARVVLGAPPAALTRRS